MVRYVLLTREDDLGRYAHRVAVDDDGRPLRPRAALAALGPPGPTIGEGVQWAVGRGPTVARALHRWICWVAGVPPTTSGLIVAVAEWLGLSRQAWEQAVDRNSDGEPRRGASPERILQTLGLGVVQVPGHGDRAVLVVRHETLPAGVRTWLDHPLSAGIVPPEPDEVDEAVEPQRGPPTPAWAEPLRQAVDRGLAAYEIRDQLGWPMSTVWRRLRRLDLKPARRRAPRVSRG